MDDLAVEILLINKINNILFTDQWKKGIKHRRVKLFYFDEKYELHFLKPECFPVPHPTLKFGVQGQKELEIGQSNLLFLLDRSVSPRLLSGSITH